MEEMFTPEVVQAIFAVGGTPAVVLFGFYKMWTRQDKMEIRLVKIETLLEANED